MKNDKLDILLEQVDDRYHKILAAVDTLFQHIVFSLFVSLCIIECYC